MAAEENLIKLIETIVSRYGNDGFITGEVVSVDKKTLTCDIKLDEDLTLHGCRLNAVEWEQRGDCFAVIPKKGSFVSGVATADLRDVLIVSFSEIESVMIKAGKIEINDFKTQLDKLSARVDGIISAIKNGKPATDYTGAALQASIVAALPLPTDKENFNTLFDYESN
ncbi:MAG: hypothetical protein II956_14355 [Bacteroidales bacterium]|nr:hypothetical protein [Bacteroidales bacterium]